MYKQYRGAVMATSSTMLTALKIEALELIRALSGELSTLSNLLQRINSNQFYGINNGTGLPYSYDEAKEYVIRAYRQIYYENDQQPNESRHFIGAVAITPAVRQQMVVVNSAKDELETFFKSLADKTVTDNEGSPQPLSRVILERTEFSRLHKLQATRSIRLLSEQPRTISFSMRKSPGVIKISKEQAINMVLANHQGTAEDNYSLSVLSKLPDDEILAYKKIIPPKPIVNLTFENGTVPKNAVLPIAYPQGDLKTVLKANQSVKPGSQKVHHRRPAKLMPEPLIAHPEIYQYRSPGGNHASKKSEEAVSQQLKTV